MKKNNIRSIRFSDELAELIDRQIGDTFTEKFENLITKCVWELPKREKELKSIKADIETEREKLINLLKKTRQLQDNLHVISNKATLLEASIDAVISSIK